MRYAFSLALLLILAMLTYYLPQFAAAQTEDRCNERVCNIKITKDGFVPKTLIVKIGTKVVWTNNDDGRHTVTSGSPGEITAPFKSLLLEKGDTYEFTFEYSGFYQGSYKYFDQVTQTMRGEIIVEPEEKTVQEKPPVKTIKVDFNDPNSGVKSASLSNGDIKSMEIDRDRNSLVITVETMQTGGKLEITLDRGLIDAKSDNKDDHFAVMVDGKEGFFEETSSTAAERTLEIVVPAKAMIVEIMGTKVVPEFPIAMLAIASVFSAMIITYRLRIRL